MAMSIPTVPVVKVQTSDGEVVEVPLRIAKAFEALKVMFETLGEEEYQDKDREQGPDDIIPLHHVESDMLEIIVKWVTYHKDEMSPLEDDEDGKAPKSLDNIKAWDRQFMDSFNISTLERLLGATNYLDCKGLYQLCCQALAIKIQGKPPEEIRKLFHLPDDLTPEEKEQIKKENQVWEEKETDPEEEGRGQKKAKEDEQINMEKKRKRDQEETEETKKGENEDDEENDKKEVKQQKLERQQEEQEGGEAGE